MIQSARTSTSGSRPAFRPSRRRLLAWLWFASCLPLAPAWAADFPTRPIKFIVPFTSGTGMDNIARQVGQRMATRLGQPVVVENRLGTAGNLGAEMVAHSPADGYTLLVSASNLSITATLYPTPGFVPMRDLVPIAIAAWGNQTLVVNPKSEYNTLPEFLAAARAAPGKLTFASPGVGSPQHIALELLQQQAEVSFLHVPYKGTAPGVADLMAGQVDAMLVATHTVMPYVNAGKLKALAVAAQSRYRGMPQLPCFGELGLKDFTTDAWYGFLAPRGTPPDVLALLTGEIRAILNLRDVREVLEKTGLDVRPSTPEEMHAVMEREFIQYGDMIRKNHIRPD
jgi:tripartite-type tricarboxylate transporter receptor subunit TctC